MEDVIKELEKRREKARLGGGKKRIILNILKES